MKKFTMRTDNEKIQILQEIEAAKENGITVKKFCDERGISCSLIYGWKRRFGNSALAPAREIVPVASGNGVSKDDLRMLRSENQRLKMIVADQALDIMTLKEYAGRSK